jgi:hypothetical protein
VIHMEDFNDFNILSPSEERSLRLLDQDDALDQQILEFLQEIDKMHLAQYVFAEILCRKPELPTENSLGNYTSYLGNFPYTRSRKLHTDVTAIRRRMLIRRKKVNDPNKLYGLVVGKVQSGKTANMFGLAASIIDEESNTPLLPYGSKPLIPTKVVIILSGLIDDLRKQTYNRFVDDFDGFPCALIGPRNESDLLGDEKFKNEIGKYFSDNFTSYQQPQKPLFIIVKKHPQILAKLSEILNCEHKNSGFGSLESSWLIIDDECDYASLDRNHADQTNNTESITNENLRTLIQDARAVSTGDVWYVGYTATPYSNILSNPHAMSDDFGPSLFPTGFISLIEPPYSHFDNSFYFNSPEGKKHIVEYDEQKESLEEVYEIFLLLHILSYIAKNLHLKIETHHTSMIHLHRETKSHAETLRELIDSQSKLKAIGLEYLKTKLIDCLYQKYSSMGSEQLTDIVHIISNLSGNDLFAILNTIEFIELNRRDNDVETDEDEISNEFNQELNYSDDNIRNLIVTGGARISRGLTLEGLTISLFLRTANTPSYDTMLQMARWNGYREDYDHLVRIITSKDISDDYQKIAIAESDMRSQIRKYDDKSDPVEMVVDLLEFQGLKLSGNLPTKEFLTRMIVVNEHYIPSKIYSSHPPELISGTSTFDIYSELFTNIETLSIFEKPPKKERNYMVANFVPGAIIKHLLEEYLLRCQASSHHSNEIIQNLIKSLDENVHWNVGYGKGEKQKKKVTVGFQIAGLFERTPDDLKGFDPIYSNYDIASEIDLIEGEERNVPLLLLYFSDHQHAISKLPDNPNNPIPLFMIILPNPLGIGGSMSERLRGHRDGSVFVHSMTNKSEEE